jgi:2',3'-cyclic-nucleotide 2'-phosphodiesterase (5'-nucleotidase family)
MNFHHTLPLLVAVFLTTTLSAENRRHHGEDLTVAVFSLNDFHGGFVRDDNKHVPGAAAVCQTLDSLKEVYPHHLTVSAGDIFGGSYFYAATEGALLPTFFNDLGIRISALGNHEFDNGQEALARKWHEVRQRPADWDIDYVCANVRKVSGGQPEFVRPYATAEVVIDKKRTVRLGLVGLIASSTPQQASASKLVGLSFDGRYEDVLDSVRRLPGYADAVGNAHIRLLLTHIGTVQRNGTPAWDDLDVPHLEAIQSPEWDAIISSHSHQKLEGRINTAQYPVVQGRWHGEYISALFFHLDPKTLRVRSVTTEICPVRTDLPLGPRAQRLQQQVDSLLTHTTTHGGTPIGEILTEATDDLGHVRENKYRQSPVGSLVCRAYAEAYRHGRALSDSIVIVGASHIGTIRSGFIKGPVSVLDVGEVLPFANRLRAFRMTGEQLQRLVDFGRHNRRFGWLQTGWLHIDGGADGSVDALAYCGPDGSTRPIAADTPCLVVVDEFIVTGGDGYDPALFPLENEVSTDGLPTTTDAFINYLRTFPVLPKEEALR